MEKGPPEATLQHAAAARTAQVDELREKTGDTLYPADADEQARPGPPKDPRDVLVPSSGDVKAATSNPKFGEAGGATPPEAASSHGVASAGDIHAPTAHPALK